MRGAAAIRGRRNFQHPRAPHACAVRTRNSGPILRAPCLPVPAVDACACVAFGGFFGRIPHNFYVPLEIWQLFLRAPCCWRSLVRHLLRRRSTGIWEISGRRGVTGTPGVGLPGNLSPQSGCKRAVVRTNSSLFKYTSDHLHLQPSPPPSTSTSTSTHHHHTTTPPPATPPHHQSFPLQSCFFCVAT